MLEIKNVEKYFNKGHKNQIHVINNTSLSLDKKGLVALLGPSGCGKTTLLNTIGGLDKIKSGSIYIDGNKISTNSIRKVDKIRNLKIGYIFQDYKLIDHLSVYDNVAIVLKMLGLKDKEEIKNKVEYVLEKVGMLRYQRRPASMLSGGERQRVGIARAIVKNPDIILADEPTGNLDSKNTLEIMNIIKAISKERLVILVTHEQDLAKFYATRIIEIEDGTIKKDYENDLDGELDYRHDNTFYLKDFSNIINLNKSKPNEESSQNYNLRIFSNQPINLNLDIVLKNGNIYIKSNDHTKTCIVDDNNSIDFIDDHYQKIAKNNIKYQFDFSKLESQNQKRKYTSIFNLFNLITNGFKQVLAFPILKKFLLAGFFLAGMFIMYSVSSIAASLTIHEEDFIKKSKNYLIIEQATGSISKYLEYEQLENIDYLIPGTSIISLALPLNDYYQSQNMNGSLTGSLTNLENVSKADLILGRYPENKNEILVDNLVLKRALNNSDIYQMIGLTKEEDFLNRTIKIKNMKELKIVGITNTTNPSIYVDKSLFINIISNANNQNTSPYYSNYYEEETESPNIIDYHLYQEDITITKGRLPENDYEVIVPHTNIETTPLNKEINITINNKKLTVVGYYDSKYSYNYYLTNPNMIKLKTIENNPSITIATNNKETILKILNDKQVNIKDCYEEDKKNYLNEKQEEMRATIIVSAIILIISLIEIFLMIRSSFLSRIKEIGIYRAIGVKKSDIYKMFSGEIIAITTIASLPGLILMAYILEVLSEVEYLSSYIMINPLLLIISIIFSYLFNLIIGLIPIYNTIKKRPAQILARHDLD